MLLLEKTVDVLTPWHCLVEIFLGTHFKVLTLADWSRCSTSTSCSTRKSYINLQKVKSTVSYKDSKSVCRKLFCLSLLTCYLNIVLSFIKQGKSTLQLKVCHSGLRLPLIPDGWSTTDVVADICCQQQVTFPACVKLKIYHRWSRKNVRTGDLKESI